MVNITVNVLPFFSYLSFIKRAHGKKAFPGSTPHSEFELPANHGDDRTAIPSVKRALIYCLYRKMQILAFSWYYFMHDTLFL